MSFFRKPANLRQAVQLGVLAGVLGTMILPSYAEERGTESIAVHALEPGVRVSQPTGRRLAQLIVPQQPANQSGDLKLQDFSPPLQAPVELRKISISGNERVSDGRIREFFDFEIGSQVDSSMINKGLGRLYRSGLFQDFRADINENGTLSIEVVENPIINRIAFEGNSTLKDELLETVISSRPRRVYSVNGIDDDVRKIQTAYRQSGRFAAVIKPVIIKHPRNRVDLVFEIDEGGKTLVETINFVGNSFASDGELKDEMLTKPSNLLSLIFGGDTYDPDKLSFDAENIRNFYLRHGYADFRVLSTTSELDASREGFVITITMEEGQPYNFGEIDLVSDISELDLEALRAAILFASGDRFNNTLVQSSLVAVENAAQEQGVPFVRAEARVHKDLENQQIAIAFAVVPGPKRYIETINIHGNVRTLDYVIRRELRIAEGDPISFEKIALSEQQLRDLNFFKSVEIVQRQGTNANDVVLDVSVEEKSTGSLSAGLGLSTSSGAFATFGISEHNFLGRGQELSARVTLGNKTRNYDISFLEPRFLDRDLSARFSVFKSSDDGASNRKYNFERIGSSINLSQELFSNWYHSSGLSVSKLNIDGVQSDASLIIKNQKGRIRKTTFSQGLFYDTRNSTLKPTQGYRVGGTVGLTGIVGSYKMLKTNISASWYWPLNDNTTLNLYGFAGRVTPISGTDIRISDNYFSGGESDIRGFKSNGIGPRVRSTSEALGGRDKLRGSVSLVLPSGLPKHAGINLIAFSDFGFVRNHGFKNTGGIVIDESKSLRVSVGLGVRFGTQIPISILFAVPVKKEKWDRTENFVISFGAHF